MGSRRALGGVVLGLGASLVLSVAAIATFAWAAPRDMAPTGFRAYLAVDPAPRILSIEPADAAAGGPITSSSSQSGFLSALSGIPSQSAAAAVLSATDVLGGIDGTQVLRAMSSSVNSDGSIATTFYVAIVDDSGLLKSAEMGSGGFTLWYSPPLVELPADPTVGTTWSGEGMVNDVARYEVDGTVEASRSDDCIDTVTTTKLIIEGSDPIVTRLRNTWCLGRGSTVSVNLDTGHTVSVLTDVPRSRLSDASPPIARTYVAPASLPFLSPSIALPAVVSGDVLVMVNSSSEDVVAVPLTPPAVDPDDPGAEPPDLSTLPVAWMQHPGGEVLGLSSDGQNAYVSSTTRAITSFDRAGGMRWRSMTSDVAAGAPAVLGDVVVVATLDGSVFGFDRSTGVELWRGTMTDAVVAAPVATTSTVVVADIAGHVLALDARGEEVWTAETGAVTRPVSALADGSVLVGDDGGAVSLFEADGTTRWTGTLAGRIGGAAQLADGVIVIPTNTALQGLDASDGGEAWRDEDWAGALVWPSTGGVTITSSDRAARVLAGGAVGPTQVVAEVDGDPVTDMQVVVVSGRSSLLTSNGSLLPWPGQ